MNMRERHQDTQRDEIHRLTRAVPLALDIRGPARPRLRKLHGAISHSRTSVIFINQLREKVGIVFGNPEVTPGGRALKFYSSVRIDLRRVETLKQGTNPVGSRVRAKIVKNKVAPPFRQ